MNKKVKELLERVRGYEGRGFFKKQEKLGDEELNAQLTAWCEKLESGEYEQVDGSLYDEELNAYCCLGIAGLVCEVKPEVMYYLNYPYDDKIKESSDEPLWAFLQNRSISRYLAELNDSDRFTFEEIATLIKYKYNL